MSDSTRVGGSEAEAYRVGRHDILVFGYNDTRVSRWLFQEAMHGLRGVLGNVE